MANHDINKWVDDALNSLDGVSRAKASPYLMTRINAGIRQADPQSFWQKAAAFIGRPSIALAGLILFLAVGFLLVGSKENSSANYSQSSTGNNNYEFAINVNSNYDIENPEP